MDFGRPNVEIGQKMANGRLLFLALGIDNSCYMYINKMLVKGLLVHTLVSFITI